MPCLQPPPNATNHKIDRLSGCRLTYTRYYWVVERRCWAVSFLFIAFILLCGITHLFAMLHVRSYRFA